MKLIDCGTSGTDSGDVVASWSDLDLGPPWSEVIELLAPKPRAIQRKAFAETRVLEQRKNLIVAAPTNGGKSLVGSLLLLDAVRRGGRAVLLEPLRALAREKTDDLLEARTALERVLGIGIDVQITTGDYRLNDELMTDGPPEDAQLVVATPERFDAILRNPDYQPWVSSIQAVCVDEAHLISTPRRGPVIEYLITSLLGFDSPPRITLLSASLGDVSLAQAWLSPCDVVSVAKRFPPLRKYVASLDAEDDANSTILDLADEYLQDNSASLLVFVYRTSSAESLANKWSCGAKATGQGLLTSSQVAGSQMHQIVYGVGKFFGANFKPWGAVNIAKYIGNAGKFLSLAGGALAIFAQAAEDRKQARDEEKLLESRRGIRLSYLQIAQAVEGHFWNEFEQFVSAGYDVELDALNSMRDQLVNRRTKRSQQADAFAEIIKRADESNDALHQLGVVGQPSTTTLHFPS